MDPKKAKNLDKLTREQLAALRDKVTEVPFSGELLNNRLSGMYSCAGCGTQLFLSDDKFESGTGWPSFDQAIEGRVKQVTDNSHDMERIEVVCANCGVHLGHIFEDVPISKTGKYYCINSVCLNFTAQDTK